MSMAPLETETNDLSPSQELNSYPVPTRSPCQQSKTMLEPMDSDVCQTIITRPRFCLGIIVYSGYCPCICVCLFAFWRLVMWATSHLVHTFALCVHIYGWICLWERRSYYSQSKWVLRMWWVAYAQVVNNIWNLQGAYKWPHITSKK